MDINNLSLPAWIYKDPEFLELEKNELFKKNWMFIGHTSDFPEQGSYLTFKMFDESIVVLRNESDQYSAFYNVCRHRASRLLDGDSGTCTKRIKCPYHSWTYDYDGNLLGAPNIKEYPDFDKSQNGLSMIDVEVFKGFIFVRLQPGELTVAETLSPIADELSLYKTEEMDVHYDLVEMELPVNWKIAIENFVDGIHIKFAHPGLDSLIGNEYSADMVDTIYRAVGVINEDDNADADVKRYREILPKVDHLPEHLQDAWIYYFVWPNTGFCIYPDKIEMMQFIPTSTGGYKVRLRGYALPDPRPEMKEARELADTINFKTQDEDDDLLLRVQDGLSGTSYTQGVLGSHEILLRRLTKQFRDTLPVAKKSQKPDGDLKMINQTLLSDDL